MCRLVAGAQWRDATNAKRPGSLCRAAQGHDPQVLRGALPLFLERRVRLATVEASPDMWTHPFSHTLAAVFGDAMRAGYHAMCSNRREVRITADAIVQQLARDGPLARCVDMLLCRDDVKGCSHYLPNATAGISSGPASASELLKRVPTARVSNAHATREWSARTRNVTPASRISILHDELDRVLAALRTGTNRIL